MHILSKYIPENAVERVLKILQKHPIRIKIVNNRATKHGDFKRKANGQVQITINHGLNKYQFLLTLIHEISHWVTFKENKRVKPHGKEWKRNFQHLMLPFLHPTIFPENLLSLLANYLKNPKASASADVKLAYQLMQYDEKLGKNYIFELEQGSIFSYNNRFFKKGNKRRTRYECVEMNSKRLYLFNQNAEVEIINNHKINHE